MLLVLCVFSAFMFHTYLMLATTEEFKVSFSRFGPTEMRIGLIVINALLVRFGTRPLKGALPYIALGGTIAIGVIAYRTQKKLWRADMRAKEAENRKSMNLDGSCFAVNVDGRPLQPKSRGRRLKRAFPKKRRPLKAELSV